MKKIFIFFLCMILLSGCQTQPSASQREKCELVNVIDGDTLTVVCATKKEKVRLIGIDTPESVHSDSSKNNEYGALASDYTKELLEDVEYVYLEYDKSMYDDYDRMLAYVYLTEDGSFEDSLNYILASDGYALNKEFQPNVKYSDELEDACKEAQNQEKGLWKEEGIKQIWK